MSPLFFTPGRRKRRASALLVSAAMIAGAMGPGFVARAVDPPTTPTPGFNLLASDLDFILKQIKIAEAHAAGGQLFGPGPNQVNAPQLPHGLRTVTGEFNNSTPGQEHFGAADVVFPRETTPVFRPAEDLDPDGPGPAPSSPTSYAQTKGMVGDSQPRVISNLIVDQTAGNPAVVAAAGRNDNAVAMDHDSDPLTPDLFVLPNVAPDAGLSAPYNSWFTFFGQFFDHGLDFVNKGGSGIVFMPLQPDDPLYVPGSPTNFMVLSRATNLPGPDGHVGDDPNTPSVDESADDIHEHTNQTSPFVDQNQTYTSHPSHQVFLREYEINATSGDPVSTGRMLAGAAGGLATWAEVKAQAADLLGIQLSDQDALDVPLLAADPYGRFQRGANGYVQVATSSGLVEGDPAANGGQGVAVPANAFRTGHPFLADIAHHAVPFGDHDNNPGTPPQALTPDADPGTTDDGNPATYDDELLDAHFIAGDGRVNENVALTAVHHVFHSEHNRLNGDIKALIDIDPRADFQAEWHLADGSWNGERIFQAAKFVTEMQYQHLVFEEFARKMAPGINVFGEGGFLAHHPDINPSILAEFAHAAYRLGHSMLPETVARTNADGSPNDAGLIDVFLNPLAFLDGGPAGTLTADQAAGAIVRGLTRQAGNELDEFVTEAVRNNLLGLPLDLAAINIARGRDTGLPPLNALRREIHAEAGSPAMEPYSSWVDYGFSLRNPESLVNFVAAYGTHPTVISASGRAAKRAAAALLVDCDPLAAGTPADCYEFMNSTGPWVTGPGGVTVTGLDSVDLWVGGLAEKQNPFGGLLGTTLNYIFELQLERLQTGDRLYYLSRLSGLNMLTQLEENSFADLVMRNTDAKHLPLDVFSRPDFTFEVANLGTSGPVTDDPATPWDESALLVREPNGTLRFNGGEHVLWGGTAGTDKVHSSEGDDTIWGDGGNDRLEGGTGNDQIHGGDGDDIITDTFGDDNLKGGLGNDAINAGDGVDLYLGDFGQDYLIGGDDDEQEGFAGPGDDFMYAGDALDEVSGNEGDDWIDGGLADDTLQGDNGDPLELDEIGGHDVIIGNSGSEDLHGEGGNDIMVLDSGGIELVEGMLGFDWGTHKGDTQPANSDLGVTPVPATPPLPEDVRDQFKLTEALSGWQFNDILRGDDRLAADMVGHELTSDDFGLINGLTGLLPAGTTTFTNGNIIIGGAGDDLIEGRGGDDLLDGDAWLNVRISVRSASDPNVEIQTVDRVKDLQAAVFAGLINPGQLRIVREILSNPGTDTALFSGPQSEYTITNSGGIVTVSHLGGTGADGTDTLRNFEFLQFADGTIAVPAPAPPATPTGVTATALNSSTIQVTWNPSSGATSYEVSVNGGAFTTVPGGATATSFTETGIPQNTTRSYRVRAVNAAGNSAPSAPVTATTPSTVVVNPTAFGFGNVGTGSATTTVTVTNNSDTPEAITLTKSGTRQADYTIVNNTCTGLVASGASCTYQVTFNPVNLGLLGNLMANLAGRPASITASVTAPPASAVTTFSGMGS